MANPTSRGPPNSFWPPNSFADTRPPSRGRFSRSTPPYVHQQNESKKRLIDRATLVYTSRVVNFSIHLERYMTRFREIFERFKKFDELAALSEEAVNLRMQRLSQSTSLPSNWQTAAAFSLGEIYSGFSLLPERFAAIDSLNQWNEYLRVHLDMSIPSTDEDRLERDMAAKAEQTAKELFYSYKSYLEDPIQWSIQQAHEETQRKRHQNKTALDEAHRQWMNKNAPSLLPPRAKKILRMRPDTPEFKPATASAARDVPEARKEQGPAPDSLYSGEPRKTGDIEQDLSSQGIVDDESLANLIGHLDVSEYDEISESHTVSSTIKSLSSTNVERINTSGNSFSESQTRTTIDTANHSHSEVKKTSHTNLRKTADIVVQNENNVRPFAALLDTGNEGPNLVSDQVVAALSMDHKVRQWGDLSERLEWRGPSGEKVPSIGQIDLNFKFLDPSDPEKYAPWLWGTFHVMHLEPIQFNFGAQFMNANIEKLLPNLPTLAPLIPNLKNTAAKRKETEKLKQERDARRKQQETNEYQKKANKTQNTHDQQTSRR